MAKKKELPVLIATKVTETFGKFNGKMRTELYRPSGYLFTVLHAYQDQPMQNHSATFVLAGIEYELEWQGQ